jgi:mRNA-degrading endonuclease toxin of MazEF toxin-antitoxin module
MPIKQGDIYWVDIPKAHTQGSEQYKRRPFIIVSRTELNKGKIVVGVPMTSETRKAGQHRTLIPAGEVVKDPA